MRSQLATRNRTSLWSREPFLGFGYRLVSFLRALQFKRYEAPAAMLETRIEVGMCNSKISCWVQNGSSQVLSFRGNAVVVSKKWRSAPYFAKWFRGKLMAGLHNTLVGT